MAEGKTMGVISIKGGVGKTTAALNLANVIANEFGKKVLLVDANFTAPNLGLHLGVTEPEVTIQDVFNRKVDIIDAIIDTERGVHTILGSLKKKCKVEPVRLKKELAKVKNFYDYIIIDSSPSLNDEILATMVASDELILFTTPDFPSLFTSMKAVKHAKQRKTPILGIVINRSLNKRFELKLEEIEKTAQVPVLAILPENINVMKSLTMSRTVSTLYPNSDIAIEYKKLAAGLIGEEYRDPRPIHRIKDLFSQYVPKDAINRQLARMKKAQ